MNITAILAITLLAIILAGITAHTYSMLFIIHKSEKVKYKRIGDVLVFGGLVITGILAAVKISLGY